MLWHNGGSEGYEMPLPPTVKQCCWGGGGGSKGPEKLHLHFWRFKCIRGYEFMQQFLQFSVIE